MDELSKSQTCPGCKVNLPATVKYFHKGSGKYGLNHYCKECKRRYEKERYWNKPGVRLNKQRKEQMLIRSRAERRLAREMPQEYLKIYYEELSRRQQELEDET